MNLQTCCEANFINVKILLQVDVVMPAIFAPCCQLLDKPVFREVIDMLLLAPFYAQIFVRPFFSYLAENKQSHTLTGAFLCKQLCNTQIHCVLEAASFFLGLVLVVAIYHHGLVVAILSC